MAIYGSGINYGSLAQAVQDLKNVQTAAANKVVYQPTAPAPIDAATGLVIGSPEYQRAIDKRDMALSKQATQAASATPSEKPVRNLDQEAKDEGIAAASEMARVALGTPPPPPPVEEDKITRDLSESEQTAANGIQELINSFTAAMAAQNQQMSNLAAAAAKPTVVQTKTKRMPGGMVNSIQVYSDGSEKVIDTYKDLSASDSVVQMFSNAGLDASFSTALNAVIDKVYLDNIAPTDAQILSSVYASDAYKTRFAANEVIRKRLADGKGLPGDRLLTPKEYITAEAGYKEILQEAGLPSEFYDSPDDLNNIIASSVSVSEFTSRVNMAKDALQNADQNVVNALKDYYDLDRSQLTAYLLDPEKAMASITGKLKYKTPEETVTKAKEMYTAAQVGGAALRAGQTATAGFAEEITKAGKAGQAEEAFQTASGQAQDYRRLLSLAGETANNEDLVREQLSLSGGAGVAEKRKRLASAERARFAQKSAVDTTSLGRRNKLADV